MQHWSVIVVATAQAYGLTGCIVALAFLAFGIEARDPQSRGAYAFRALIAPGLVLLWPVVIWRWAGFGGGHHPPRERAHMVAWACLAIVVPALLVAGFVLRHPAIPSASSVYLGSVEGRP